MDWSLVIFGVVVVIFTWRGYVRGVFKSLARVLSLLCGYIAAIIYAAPLAALLESRTPLAGLAAYVCAALLLFVGAGLVVSLLFWLFTKIRPRSGARSQASALGGAGVGLLLGVIAGIVVVWSYSFLRDTQFGDPSQALASQQHSIVEKLSRRAAAGALRSALSLSSAKPEISRFSAALVESPVELTAHAKRLSSSDEIRDLLADPATRTALDNGNLEALQALPAFRQLARNPDLLALAESAGLLDQDGVDTEAALAARLTDIWLRTQRVKNNARVQEILNDTDFQQKLQSGNPLDLLTNPRLLELADIIYADVGVESEADGLPLDDQSPRLESKIYSWTDASGRIHYSDVKPEP